MATTNERERTGLLRRRPRPTEITTPPAGTVLPDDVRSGAADIPVTSVTPARARLSGVPAPPEQPGKLTPQQNADVVAHILSVNGFPAGAAELPSDVEALKRIRIDAPRP